MFVHTYAPLLCVWHDSGAGFSRRYPQWHDSRQLLPLHERRRMLSSEQKTGMVADCSIATTVVHSSEVNSSASLSRFREPRLISAEDPAPSTSTSTVSFSSRHPAFSLIAYTRVWPFAPTFLYCCLAPYGVLNLAMRNLPLREMNDILYYLAPLHEQAYHLAPPTVKPPHCARTNAPALWRFGVKPNHCAWNTAAESLLLHYFAAQQPKARTLAA